MPLQLPFSLGCCGAKKRPNPPPLPSSSSIVTPLEGKAEDHLVPSKLPSLPHLEGKTEDPLVSTKLPPLPPLESETEDPLSSAAKLLSATTPSLAPLEGRTEMTPPPPQPWQSLYMLVEMRDGAGSFVGAALHEQDIRALCASLAATRDGGDSRPRAAESTEDDYGSLLHSLLREKRKTVKTVGYYGDKRAMQEVLTQMMGIDSQSNLQPGLYAYFPPNPNPNPIPNHHPRTNPIPNPHPCTNPNPDPNYRNRHPNPNPKRPNWNPNPNPNPNMPPAVALHLFLWMPSPEEEGKGWGEGLACNLVRCIMELCSSICVCIDAENPSLRTLATSTRKRRLRGSPARTAHFRLACVKASKGGLIHLSPGFHLHLERQFDANRPRFLLSEGASKCALLYSQEAVVVNPPVMKQEYVRAGDIPSLLEQWKASADLNLTNLPNSDFSMLLKLTDPLSYRQYESLKASLQAQASQPLYREGREVYMSGYYGESFARRQYRPGPRADLFLRQVLDEWENYWLGKLKQAMEKKTGEHKKTVMIERLQVVRRVGSVINESDEVLVTTQSSFAPRKVSLWKAIELQMPTEGTRLPEPGRVVVNEEEEELLKFVFLRSNNALLFLKCRSDLSLLVRYCQFPSGNVEHVTMTLAQGCDLVAFDESTRTMAVYENFSSIVKVYRFDGAFRSCNWTGVVIDLSQYSTTATRTCIMKWMGIVPGKSEVILIDDNWRAQVFEIAPVPVLNQKSIQLPGPFAEAAISADGSYFLAFYPQAPPDDDNALAETGDPQTLLQLQLRVYLLGDSISHLKNFRLNLPHFLRDVSEIKASVVLFGLQTHLLIHSPQQPQEIVSVILTVSSTEESIAIQEVSGRSDEMSTDADRDPIQKRHRKSGDDDDGFGQFPLLDCISHIFGKLPLACPALAKERTRALDFTLAFTDVSASSACEEYGRSMLRKITQTQGKATEESFEITLKSCSLEDLISSSTRHRPTPIPTLVGAWLQKLLCLLPIQILHTESDKLRPLANGLEIDSDLGCRDAVSISNATHFGFYDAILNGWNREVVVVSSMGRMQSRAEKGRLLNHLTGSLYNAASDGRCANGVWMTVITANGDGDDGRLYVVLNFEGFGSSSSEMDQEDLLLSLLSAALSNVTLFNQKELCLDEKIRSLFRCFQGGADLVKKDPCLFRGLLDVIVHDVDAADIEDLKADFAAGMDRMCSPQSLGSAYDGDVQITAMLPFCSPDFEESVLEVADTIQCVKSSHCYMSGGHFLSTMKLLIAQISVKDWSPLHTKRAELRLNLLRQHVQSVIGSGCLASESGGQPLTMFDSGDSVTDFPIEVDGHVIELPDTGLELVPGERGGSVSGCLGHEFEKIKPRSGNNDELWFSLFQRFSVAVVERRRRRVISWLQSNIHEFSEDGDAQRLKVEVYAALADHEEDLTCPCGIKCTKCFLKCILRKGHPFRHSCQATSQHLCESACSYCAGRKCGDAAGHGGRHDCKMGSHSCGKTCHLALSSSNCNSSCAMPPGHSGLHACNSLRHICNMVCSVPSCKNICVATLTDHDVHACGETVCPSKCSMPSCARPCAMGGHFHNLADPTTKHMCRHEHLCPSECESPGICKVQTQLIISNFGSEQSGLRKACTIAIPAFQDAHNGPHMHSADPNSVHYCDHKCPGCGYFCDLPFGHTGLHNTAHGDTNNKKAICTVDCGTRGRGHTHLIPCPRGGGGVCAANLFDGARHRTMEAENHTQEEEEDEMTHETYWRHARFFDPCASNEQKEAFSLCSHLCPSEDHNPDTDAAFFTGSKKKVPPYCLEKLWHTPVTRHASGRNDYVSDDGHRFPCNHQASNPPFSVIFIVDKSGSMAKTDMLPTLPELQTIVPNRLGRVYDAIIKFTRIRSLITKEDSIAMVVFDERAKVAVPTQMMMESALGDLFRRNKWTYGGTAFSSGLEKAETLLDEMLSAVQSSSGQAEKKPVLIFISDGGNNGGDDPVRFVKRMKHKEPSLILHSIKLGVESTTDNVLRDMAEAGEGAYQLCIDGLQLDQSFRTIAESLLTSKKTQPAPI